jgi:hypothetical protein
MSDTERTMMRTASRSRRRFGPWPALWILDAAGHALGNEPHPQPAPASPLVARRHACARSSTRPR